jgi:hypothetical protein
MMLAVSQTEVATSRVIGSVRTELRRHLTKLTVASATQSTEETMSH